MQAIASVLNKLGHLLSQCLHGKLPFVWRRKASGLSLSTLRLGRQASCLHWQPILSILLGCLTGITGCSSGKPAPPPRHISLQQTWELQPGDNIAGHLVSASLGDVSIDLDGSWVHAPFDGEVEPAVQPHCVFFSSPEVPAYLFRLCGIERPRIGHLKLGEVIGRGDYLHFATLRRQPEGTWTIVEPSSSILERALQPTSQNTAPTFRAPLTR
ncbi:MAG: hypothetical protein QNJ46_18180 [Leptolyngbyaceae cyanobacterium MO_188.B28]|nr:hypothetical protein [Leptolyngbyaceae cyanobacterium MO_188.B28]